MGVSINLHVYDRDQLVNDIHEHVINNGGYRDGALPAREFLDVVGGEFGMNTADQFLVVWNEYYDDYNPAGNFLRAVDDYYFPGHDELGKQSERGYWDSFWADGYKTCSDGANSGEVLSELFESEFGYEGKFRSVTDG